MSDRGTFNREQVRAKCEATGLDEVKKRRAAGAYAGWKLAVVDEWITDASKRKPAKKKKPANNKKKDD